MGFHYKSYGSFEIENPQCIEIMIQMMDCNIYNKHYYQMAKVDKFIKYLSFKIN